MNRFISHKSLLFVVFAWSVALILFADAANIDDLCSGAIVLHDDDEIAGPVNPGLVARADQRTMKQPSAAQKTREQKHDAKKAPAPSGRVIVDQDSPSLAADSRVDAIFSSFDAKEPALAVEFAPPGLDALYLRFCTLLI